MSAILTFAGMRLALPAAAEEVPASRDAESAKLLVERELVQPLAVKERDHSRFSRARLPAQERRVRILDRRARKDAAGNAFVAFAVDARHGVLAAEDESGWRVDAIVGCVYVDRAEIFVKSGDRFRPAAFLLGKNLKPVAEQICQDAPTEVAKAK
ncbi:MAG TPA: hypothetical protein VKE22_08655 [Haliangiales bacterium]|nr:hypothetical protein [Haliangiales bacterium]